MTIITKYPRAIEHDGFPLMNDLPVAADTLINEGAYVGVASGYMREAQDGDVFAGIAELLCDNTGGSAGDKSARLRERGRLLATVTGVSAVTNLGTTVYLHGVDTLSTTQGSGQTFGKVVRHVSGAQCVVAFEAAHARSL